MLKNADFIACEDTRTSGKLLKRFSIETRMFSFHAHNEHNKVHYLRQLLDEGKTVALISDAGTPAISDPGYMAVNEAIEAGHTICSIPGPSAAITALAASGLPTDRFVFEGFLPQKKGRLTKLKLLAKEERTILLYESPYRIKKLLGEISEHFGADRNVVLGRELTKTFEEYIRGTASDLFSSAEKEEMKIKGEFVVMIEGIGSKKKNDKK
jgi:16S rRNA (cytidine1402-2'-O)-methyltransferase